MGSKKFIENTELVQVGFANGISLQLDNKMKKEGNQNARLSEEERQEIIEKAAVKFGEFMDELGIDWRNDPNSDNTPYRVAKSYVEDYFKGRYEPLPLITAFPSDGYDGMVFEGNIPLTSMCSHHHALIQGKVHIAYVATENGKVVGLSKLNRIVDHFGKRGQIQEQLTVAIHNAVDKICEGNQGVAVMIEATHSCVQCRGVKHQGTSMKTSKLSGCFLDEGPARAEFYEFVKNK